MKKIPNMFGKELLQLANADKASFGDRTKHPTTHNCVVRRQRVKAAITTSYKSLSIHYSRQTLKIIGRCNM